jgi:hypothetical protein
MSRTLKRTTTNFFQKLPEFNLFQNFIEFWNISILSQSSLGLVISRNRGLETSSFVDFKRSEDAENKAPQRISFMQRMQKDTEPQDLENCFRRMVFNKNSNEQALGGIQPMKAGGKKEENQTR